MPSTTQLGGGKDTETRPECCSDCQHAAACVRPRTRASLLSSMSMLVRRLRSEHSEHSGTARSGDHGKRGPPGSDIVCIRSVSPQESSVLRSARSHLAGYHAISPEDASALPRPRGPGAHRGRPSPSRRCSPPWRPDANDCTTAGVRGVSVAEGGGGESAGVLRRPRGAGVPRPRWREPGVLQPARAPRGPRDRRSVVRAWGLARRGPPQEEAEARLQARRRGDSWPGGVAAGAASHLRERQRQGRSS